MSTLKVIDLSHHQIIKKDLSNASAKGVIGMIHKITDGLTYNDQTADGHIRLAKDQAMLIGGYHFLQPNNASRQAEHFVARCEKLGILDDNFLVAVDFEKIGTTPSEALECLQRMEKLTGRSPVIYGGSLLKNAAATKVPELAEYRLWLAQYGASFKLPPNFKKYWLWQYSEHGKIDGIVGDVDFNTYQGIDRQLRQEWSGNSHSNMPDVVEKEDDSTIIGQNDLSTTEPEPAPKSEPQPATQDVHVEEGGKADIISKVDAVANKWTSIQAIAEKFGLSDPTAVRSKGSIALVATKFVGGAVMTAIGFAYNYWELFVIAGLLFILGYLLWNNSGKRVADAKAGVPIALLKQPDTEQK